MARRPTKVHTSEPSSPLNSAPSEAEYSKNLSSYRSLCQEAEFIISESLREADIKIHEVESRIKTYNSLSRKIETASATKNQIVNDIVGLRIICLFRSDLEKIFEIIRKEFVIISSDDKISSSSNTFGYMSIHHICKLKSNVSGRRYDSIKGAMFEIQVRTLCMHAWASISHYLDYKSEWEIPQELRKDLNALSALFYLADTQYEYLSRERIINNKEISENISSGENDYNDLLINFDTLNALLIKKYPSRNHNEQSISSLTTELIEAGIEKIEELDKLLDENQNNFEQEERNREQGPFATAGVVRISLKDSHERYKKVYDKKMRS